MIVRTEDKPAVVRVGTSPRTATVNGESLLGSGDITVGGGGDPDWDDITNKPDEFPPEDHSHTKSDITDFSHSHTKSDITDFSHSHTKSDISDFSHTHTTSEVTDFPSLATVATSGSYNDLTDQPTIPTVPGIVSTSANGLAPKVTDTSKFLKGDGTWAAPPNTTYESKTAASGGTAVSLCTTGEKYMWNSKASVSTATASLNTTWTTSGSGFTKTVSVSGVTASNTVIVTPDPASYEEYHSCAVRATSQASGSLTFYADTKPTSTLTANVLIVG